MSVLSAVTGESNQPKEGFGENNTFISPVADLLRSEFDLMYDLLKYPIMAKSKSLSYVKSKIDDWIKTLNSIARAYEELLRKINELEASLEGNLNLELAQEAFNYFKNLQYARRLLGEANYWQLYNTLALLADGAGGIVADLITNLKELIKILIRALLSTTEGYMHFESYISLITQSYSSLYLKTIDLDRFLPESIVPNVTSSYYYKDPEPGNPYPTQSDYRPIVAPIFTPEAILDGSFTLYRPDDPSTYYVLQNRDEMTESYIYWKSSYSNCNNLPNYSGYIPGVNNIIGFGPRKSYKDHENNSQNPLKIGETFHQLDTDYTIGPIIGSEDGNSISIVDQLTDELAEVTSSFYGLVDLYNAWMKSINQNITEGRTDRPQSLDELLLSQTPSISDSLKNGDERISRAKSYKDSIDKLITKYRSVNTSYLGTNTTELITEINNHIRNANFNKFKLLTSKDTVYTGYINDDGKYILILNIAPDPLEAIININYASTKFITSRFTDYEGNSISPSTFSSNLDPESSTTTLITEYNFRTELNETDTNKLVIDRIGNLINRGRQIYFPVMDIYGRIVSMESWKWQMMELDEFINSYTQVNSKSDIYYNNDSPEDLIYKGTTINSTRPEDGSQVTYVLYHKPFCTIKMDRGGVLEFTDRYYFLVFPSESATVYRNDDGTYKYDTFNNYIPRYPNSYGPKSNAWSIIDCLNEMQLMIESMESICSDYDGKKKQFNDLLSELGLDQPKLISQLPDGNGVHAIYKLPMFEELGDQIERAINSIYQFRSEILRITNDW